MPRLAFALAFALIAPVAHGSSPAERMTLRTHVLRLINRDRAMYGVPPVQLDETESLVADDYCRRQIANGTTGHFTTDGLAPYMRYSFAGGNDGVSENAAAWSSSRPFSERAVYELVGRSQDAMMAEMPPHDGHRRTILDRNATHVAIGVAWEGGEFRLVHEFIRHYVEWSRPLERQARVGDRLVGGGHPIGGAEIDVITLHYEPVPAPLTAAAASRIDTYALPQNRREYVPRVRSDGSFSFAVPLNQGPGIYTVVLWVRTPSSTTPFPASNVSVRVSAADADSFALAGTR